MRTNSKIVMNKIYNHINDYFMDLEYDGCSTLQEKIKSQIDYMITPKETIYKCGVRMVNGAYFLIYNDDIRSFIETLDLNNNSNKHFDDYQVFTFYSHILGLMIERIYKGYQLNA